MDLDEIGSIGEALFKGWCAQSLMTPFPALGAADKYGWDYYVQLRAPAGRHEAPERSCKVQLKTSTVDTRSAGIKLSNWERMAKELTSWFVCYVLLEGVEPRDVYLVHVDEEQVARVLKKLRELGPDAALHQERMSLTACEHDALAQPFHENLRDAIKRHLGPSEETYASTKSAWIKKSGYELRPHTATLTTQGSNEAEIYNQMAEWAVGRIEALPITALKIVETRFGISLPVRESDSGEGHIEFESLPSIGSTPIAISNTDRSEMMTLNCTTHIARTVLPFLPPAYERFRFVARYVTLTIRPPTDAEQARVNIQLEIPEAETKAPLSELARACKLVRLLLRARSDGLRAEIPLGNTKPATIDLSAMEITPDLEFQRFARVMEDAAFIAKHFDLELSIEVTPTDLLIHEFNVSLMAAGLDRSVNGWALQFATKADESVHGKRSAAVVTTYVALGSNVVLAGFTLVGIAIWSRASDGSTSVKLDALEVRVAFKKIVPVPEWDVEIVNGKVEETVKELEEEGTFSLILM